MSSQNQQTDDSGIDVKTGTAGSIHVENLTKEFDTQQGHELVFEDISFDVEPGSFVTLLGKSGSGKSTMLNIISDVLEPTSGEVRFETDDPSEEVKLGHVFQSPRLLPWNTLVQNIELVHEHNPDFTRELAEKYLDLVGLSEHYDKYPTQLSGGQQQRIALARALAPGPELLLLDEPLSALDVRLRERLRVTLREIQQSLDITTVYVTHDQEEALAISDRVAVVADGGIEQVGSPEAIYRSPASRFVAEFVGDNNVFDRTVQGSDPPHVSIDDQAVPLEAAPTLSQGDRATLSIRPEDLSFHERDVSITVTVQQVEFLGDAYRVHCEWGETEILVKTTDDDIPRETVTLWFDVTDVYVVDRSATE
jgi:ABC-type Fe3+/spermidine/putrescine transport system ATPase subunit